MREPVFPVPIHLPGASTGIGQALQSQLRDAIVSGRLHAGMRLPSTRKAALGLGIGRNTIISVYERLIAEGYLVGRVGACPEVAALRRAPPAQEPGLVDTALAASRLPTRWRGQLADHGAIAAAQDSFRTGMPDARYFPHPRWRQLMQRSIRQWARRPFCYPASQGMPELRQAIARHVSFARAISCSPDDVIVTSGATQAFALLAQVLVEGGASKVAVEWPGYPATANAFAAAGAALLHVPVDAQGLCVEQIPADAGIVCVTPSHQSPCGVALSPSRRGALLDHAQRSNALIIEDDYDGEFRYGARPLDALKTLDVQGRVFYVGTFSKSMFPSLRLGYIIAPGWAREALVTAKHATDPHGSDVVQTALAAFINEGDLARHVRRMQREYARRRSLILAALQGPLSAWLFPLHSEAGLHLAAQVHEGVDSQQVLAAARRHLPGIASIAELAQAPAAAPGLVFGFGCIEVEKVAEYLWTFTAALTR
ncbi:hypothetical protein ABB27_12885 [Stenotrophomonas terrae]|uniref:HTH gntR-type domain-containing protein n=1 Tax=Stenotrophomonas terrae TaxID=405446 RepID=A0A0R0CC20_9GAMM|nr:PLP-dependent aminotransferase family protein [Stenotrophomonas terrae]KRG66741.1 hypothetical protein ABB27_12885 [Stenotrophomonas terrae]